MKGFIWIFLSKDFNSTVQNTVISISSISLRFITSTSLFCRVCACFLSVALFGCSVSVIWNIYRCVFNLRLRTTLSKKLKRETADLQCLSYTLIQMTESRIQKNPKFENDSPFNLYPLFVSNPCTVNSICLFRKAINFLQLIENTASINATS